MTDQTMIESLEGQLRELYREREHLHDRFGASSPEDIAVMIESLESQLRDFYNRFGSNPGFDDAEIAMTLGKIKELSSTLDPMYAKKSVHFFVENDKPVLRAEWTDITTEGDPS